MTDSFGSKFSRRFALRSAGVLSAATALGCESGGDAPGADASMPAPDGGTTLDGGRPLRDGGPPPTGPFQHGVASGDPLPDAVILWTRITTEGSAAIEVGWELATEPSFASIAAMGTASADATRDFTVKVDATGLSPATTYYYRFRVASSGELSPVGRTRTAPEAMADVARLRFAVCACSNYAYGYFHGYRNIAGRADLDAVIHLGDYIYEYGTGEYGSFRECDPSHEIVSLDDYRRRYRQYRSDPDLQEVHRQHPFITVWDDHESTNDSWRDGAENHQASEGDWATRKTAAQQAYDEWLPIRTNAEGPSKIWRALRYGNLAELLMLDTRLDGRSAQGEGEPADRALLSEEQERWLIERLTGTTAQWKLIGQQVMFAPLPLLQNNDQWDGYPAARARIVDTIRTGGEGGARIDDVVVLTGDIHTSWAIEVVEDAAASPLPAAAAVEFVAPGITSPGLGAPGSSIERSVAQLIERRAPHIKYHDVTHRGYYVLDLTRARAQASFVQIVDIEAPYDASEAVAKTWQTPSGESRLSEVEPDPPPASAPALAP